MNPSFYALIFRQKYIRRWGLMRNVHDENLAEHASEVAILTHALATIGNLYFGKHYDTNAAVTAALFHDVPEVFTGDLPTPIKYSSNVLRENYAGIEDGAVKNFLSHLPDEMKGLYEEAFTCPDPELHTLVKAADKLAAYIKCVEEQKCGNSEFREAEKSTYRSLTAMKCPELDYFMREYLPAFSMTLDEMQKN